MQTAHRSLRMPQYVSTSPFHLSIAVTLHRGNSLKTDFRIPFRKLPQPVP